MERGKFIVIEGTDGSGKGTQTELLRDKLVTLGQPVETIDFPRYEDNEYGKLVGRYLKGEFGGIDEVSPYLAALAYAGDRKLAQPQIESWLDEGALVVANRYVLSSKAHQTARMPENKRQEFIEWLDKLEYGENGIPREDLVLFLYVPLEVSDKNVEQKGHRSYIGAGKDIHEADQSHMTTTADIYLQLASQEPHWVIVECTKNGEMRTREAIHEEIMQVLQDRHVLSTEL